MNIAQTFNKIAKLANVSEETARLIVACYWNEMIDETIREGKATHKNVAQFRLVKKKRRKIVSNIDGNEYFIGGGYAVKVRIAEVINEKVAEALNRDAQASHEQTSREQTSDGQASGSERARDVAEWLKIVQSVSVKQSLSETRE